MNSWTASHSICVVFRGRMSEAYGLNCGPLTLDHKQHYSASPALINFGSNNKTLPVVISHCQFLVASVFSPSDPLVVFSQNSFPRLVCTVLATDFAATYTSHKSSHLLIDICSVVVTTTGVVRDKPHHTYQGHQPFTVSPNFSTTRTVRPHMHMTRCTRVIAQWQHLPLVGQGRTPFSSDLWLLIF